MMINGEQVTMMAPYIMCILFDGMIQPFNFITEISTYII